MGIIDVFVMAMKNLFKRKVRTVLTVLGVTIGTTAIVVVISLGIAANMNFDRTLENFDDVLTIELRNWGNWSPEGPIPSDVPLTNAMIDYINSWDEVEVATPLMEMWSMNAQIGRRTNTNFSVLGVRPEAMHIMRGFQEPSEGTLLQPGGDKFQAVFGEDVIFGFMTDREREQYWREQWGGGGGGFIIGGFGSTDSGVHSVAFEQESTVATSLRVVPAPARPMPGRPGMPGTVEPPERVPLVDIFTETVEISYVWGVFTPPEPPNPNPDPNIPVIVINRDLPIYELYPVGIMQSDDWMLQRSIIMDIEGVMYLQNAMEQRDVDQGFDWAHVTDFDVQGFNHVLVRARDVHVAEQVFLRLEEMGFDHVWSPIGQVSSLREQSNNLQMLLTLVGAVSLIVAFIGIANTMIMSIYERTREIGVMKVIGAALSDIGKLFLSEAGMIGIMGGLLGSAAGYGLSYFLNQIPHMENVPRMLQALLPQGFDGAAYVSYIPLWLYGLALAFSALVGLVAGFLPAMRAMRVSALTAIRTD